MRALKEMKNPSVGNRRYTSTAPTVGDCQLCLALTFAARGFGRKRLGYTVGVLPSAPLPSSGSKIDGHN